MSNQTPTTDILTTITAGNADLDLEAIHDAVRDRRRYIREIAAVELRASIHEGDSVRFNDTVRPLRMIGRTAKVVKVNPKKFVIVLDEPDQRFTGRVTVPATMIEKVA